MTKHKTGTMNIVKIKGKDYDIDTPEGARAYLESEGCDVDKAVKDGMKIINEVIRKLNH